MLRTDISQRPRHGDQVSVLPSGTVVASPPDFASRLASWPPA